MLQHDIKKLIIRPLRIGEAKLEIGRFLLARTGMPIALISSFRRSRLGGFFRYSMTIVSSPLCRIIPSTVRDVKQLGL
jgi:hypothetical protein